ncbi:MAG TPA: DUF3152 domain-containing protein, partial [Nocardioides sp.]|nr:DUF3152 domain-containing protein [Nocardioides sp.]
AMRRLLLALVLAVLGTVLAAAPSYAGTLTPVVAPSISGTPEYDASLTASPGQWAPAASAYTYQWLRDGQPIAKATAATYRPGLDDLGRALSVTVTVDDGVGDTGAATSAPTAPVQKATLEAKGGQTIKGVARFTHTLEAHPGRYSAQPSKVSYQWLRGDRPVGGATGKRYEIRPDDVGARLRVRLTVLAPGYQPLEVVTHPTPEVRHRVDVRRTVRYHVETRGRITTSLKQFRAQAQQTYEDPRGWRAAGVRFVPVAHGGAFTLVLSQASLLPSFSSECSAMWSCRVGRFVIINQDRWKNASPAWNAAHLSLRDYRHMVVNHETGHWLGLHHVSCPGPGRLAPVMMQQSKGLHGCRFNPFPTIHELNSRTPPAKTMAMLEAESYSPGVE